MTTVAPLILALLGSVTVPLTVPALPSDCATPLSDTMHNRHATKAKRCFLIFIGLPSSRVPAGRGDELKLGLKFDCSNSNLADVKKIVGIPHPKLNEPAVDPGKWSNFSGGWRGRGQACFNILERHTAWIVLT